ncbi:hypothetical protein L596_026811 [Steinernema carpocapsae]|uniref:Uncharacterized protein n=1 Tax=Steinernema carpocapsae TaxID=34508 RepID=A0A4U5M2F8_STECR|nr:hypothetical protein L596_026811 [Steinernema carpocapsae]
MFGCSPGFAKLINLICRYPKTYDCLTEDKAVINQKQELYGMCMRGVPGKSYVINKTCLSKAIGKMEVTVAAPFAFARVSPSSRTGRFCNRDGA